MQNQGAGKVIQTSRAAFAATDQAESITGRSVAMAARVSSSGVSGGGLCTRASVIMQFFVVHCTSIDCLRRQRQLHHRQGEAQLVSLLPSPEVLRRENEFFGRAGRARSETTQAAGATTERQTEAQSAEALDEYRCRKTFFIADALDQSTAAERASGNVDTNFIDVLAASAEQRVLSSGGHSPEERHSAERLERAVCPQSVALAD